MSYATTLDGAISAAATDLYVDDLPVAPYPAFIEIGSEVMALTSVHADFATATNPTKRQRLGVVRAQMGTAAATHADEADVADFVVGAGGGSISATDGVTTVENVTTLHLPGIVSDEGGGVASLQPLTWDATGILRNPTSAQTDPQLSLDSDYEDGSGSFASLLAGNGQIGFDGGGLQLASGGSSGAGTGAQVNLNEGAADGTAGYVEILSGLGTGGHASGDIKLIPAGANGGGRAGLVFLNLPTSDPHVAGALWADTLVVTVSAG